MKVLVKDIKVPVTIKDQLSYIKKKLVEVLDGAKFNDFEIRRRAIDARNKERMVYFVYQVAVDIPAKVRFSDRITPLEEYNLPPIKVKDKIVPVIVGSGPCGLFSALLFTYYGISGTIVERGCKIEERVRKVEMLWQEGVIDEECNCQFGEGGAGTFSDGKLTTRIKEDIIGFVLREFVRFGAPEDILVDAKPHVGTEYVRKVVKNIRNFLIDNGWNFMFNTKVIDINTKGNRIESIATNRGTISGTHYIFAIGNSSRDTFKMLLNRGVAITTKAFAVGFRIENPQEVIDKNQYGKFHKYLPPATYNLSHHFKDLNRGVYSFCMCPGGYVILASSSSGEIVTNGMSYFKRDSGYANSAIVVTVDERDFGDSPLSGVEFQEIIEKKAFSITNSYQAPIQKALDFLKSKTTTGDVKTTFRPSVVPYNLEKLYPQELVDVLKKGLIEFDKRIKGFLATGVLIAPETRTSSPIRILRERGRFNSVSYENLYPAGEGSGYAGGIMSSIIDGLKVVFSILKGE